MLINGLDLHVRASCLRLQRQWTSFGTCEEADRRTSATERAQRIDWLLKYA
jgi:hypothetical protein